ncbi:MAG: SusD/RagB family nutrient-binding outer membrane lipoprotein [Chitinophagaceae bacterium]|nr:SusD/RagB family nutrient-binding outer membrane lipoprotein [Chitinophagaceae bacterium]
MNNKNLLKYFLLTPVLLTLAGCSREKFASMNTNPDDVLNVPPQYEFTTAVVGIHNNSFEYYYDYNRAIYYWDQTFVTMTGNSVNVYSGSGNLNQRTSNFYTSVGNRLVDVQHLIDIMPDAKRAQYVYMRAITGIPLIYYAWYTSDVQGSIAYSQAFQARYKGLLTPKYDTQEALYDSLDRQLKAIVAVLKTPQPSGQVSLGSNDIYFGGAVINWIKVANSLRLKMAFRLMKRSPDKLKAIATEVLSDDVGVISDHIEDWKLVAGSGFTGGNYNPASNSTVSGEKNTVDFMRNTKDPRIRIFFKKALTKDMFDSAQTQGIVPPGTVWDGLDYRGQYADPDASTDPAKAVYFRNTSYKYKGVSTVFAWPSAVQSKLFYDGYEGTPGSTTFPLITFADICFMRAELAVRGITTGDDPQQWYYKGIDESLAEYDAMGNVSKLVDYTPLDPTEVTQYKSQPGVVYDPANALEQIIVQQYLNYFKNQNEAWALIKRTGYPSVNGNILQLENVHQGGVLQAMPRRFVVTFPSVTDLNYQNVLDAINEEKKDPGFGDPTDITGRVWWDMQ